MKKKETYADSNPGLHLLYVTWAVEHLAQIEECQKLLGRFSNGNLLNIQSAMDRERLKLIQNNEAYAKAQEILNSVRDINFYRRRDDEE